MKGLFRFMENAILAALEAYYSWRERLATEGSDRRLQRSRHWARKRDGIRARRLIRGLPR